MKEKVVLAYSGGLDTTAIIPWLKENYDYEVICCCVDCGQGNELDGLDDLVAFADKLERATLDTIEAGEMTGDLALITTLPNPKKLSTRDFILAIAKRLEA